MDTNSIEFLTSEKFKNTVYSLVVILHYLCKLFSFANWRYTVLKDFGILCLILPGSFLPVSAVVTIRILDYCTVFICTETHREQLCWNYRWSRTQLLEPLLKLLTQHDLVKPVFKIQLTCCNRWLNLKRASTQHHRAVSAFEIHLYLTKHICSCIIQCTLNLPKNYWKDTEM